METNNTLIKVENLTKVYRISRKASLKAVDNVNFTIRKGETFGLVGRERLWKIDSGALYTASHRAYHGNCGI